MDKSSVSERTMNIGSGQKSPASEPSMMAILQDLTPLNRVISSSDYDRTIEYLKRCLPFTELAYEAAEAR